MIQQTVRETLPEGFQRSEFLLDHGALDMIVDRRDLRDRIGDLLRLLLNKSSNGTTVGWSVRACDGCHDSHQHAFSHS